MPYRRTGCNFRRAVSIAPAKIVLTQNEARVREEKH